MRKKAQAAKVALAALALASTAGRVLAHPGHGDPRLAGTALHYLLEPRHVAWALGAATAAWLAAALAATWRLRSRQAKGIERAR